MEREMQDKMSKAKEDVSIWLYDYDDITIIKKLSNRVYNTPIFESFLIEVKPVPTGSKEQEILRNWSIK